MVAFVAIADVSSPFVADGGNSDVCSSMGVWLPLCVPSPNQTATAALGTFLGAEALAEDLPVAFFGAETQAQYKRLSQAAAVGLWGSGSGSGSGSGMKRKQHHDLTRGSPSEWFEAADHSDFVSEAVS